MRILVLGGSWFVGRHLVEAAAAAGHEVAVFNRGRTPAVYPDGVQVLRGDRTDPGDLTRLAQVGGWDAVLDVPEMPPDVVRAAARALVDAADRYAFVSTVSVYLGWPQEPGPFTEGSPRHAWDPATVPAGTVAAYGPSKAGGEDAVIDVVGRDRALILRPGIVIGPGEYVGRIPWWLDRAARAHDGRPVLAPGRPDRAIQPVDVRDLAAFTLHLLEDRATGAWNVAAPSRGPGAATYGDLLTAVMAAAGARRDIAWVDENWLVDQGVRQWTELPLWRTAPGTWTLDTTKATAAGLATRPLPETVADVHAWLAAGGRPVEHERWSEHGIDPRREHDLLEQWQRSQT